ncbi:MAG: hypothetical protein WCF82_03530 [Microcoleus sp.]
MISPRGVLVACIGFWVGSISSIEVLKVSRAAEYRTDGENPSRQFPGIQI